MKKFFRSKRDRKIAGVCAGLAEYLNIDSTLIRLAWALFCLAGGSGIVIYIIAALIMPNESDIIDPPVPPVV